MLGSGLSCRLKQRRPTAATAARVRQNACFRARARLCCEISLLRVSSRTCDALVAARFEPQLPTLTLMARIWLDHGLLQSMAN